MESSGSCVGHQTNIIFYEDLSIRGPPWPSQCSRCHAKVEFLGGGDGEHAECKVASQREHWEGLGGGSLGGQDPSEKQYVLNDLSSGVKKV